VLLSSNNRSLKECVVELYRMQVNLRLRNLSVIYTSLGVEVGLGACCMVIKMAARCSSQHSARPHWRQSMHSLFGKQVNDTLD
jgi:hypothetical protein